MVRQSIAGRGEFMSDRYQLENLTRALFKARDANDAAATMAYFHPDCIFQIKGGASLSPFTHKVFGKQALSTVMEGLAATWDFSAVEMTRTLIDGDTVVVCRKGGVVHVPSNSRIDTEWVDIFTVKEGLIVAFDEFVDTQLVAEVVGKT